MPGAGTSSGSQQTQQSSQSSPWAPTQPLLNNIIGQLGNVNTGVTPMQTNALNQLQTNAQGLPNYGGAVSNLAGNQLSGIPNQNNQISGAYNSVSGALNPQLQSNFLNPMSNPFTGQAMNTLNQDISNQINGLFAGAGRSLSGDNTQALARGLSQGEGGLLMNQFNTNAGLQQGAAGQLMSAAGGANSAYNANSGAGVSNIGNIASATNLSPLSSLAASNAAYSLPLSQLGGVEGMTLPIAGLGGQTQGTSNTQTQQSASPLAMMSSLFGGQYSPFSGMSNAAGGILGSLGAFL